MPAPGSQLEAPASIRARPLEDQAVAPSDRYRRATVLTLGQAPASSSSLQSDCRPDPRSRGQACRPSRRDQSRPRSPALDSAASFPDEVYFCAYLSFKRNGPITGIGLESLGVKDSRASAEAMKAVVLDGPPGEEKLREIGRPIPDPWRQEVIVRILAAARRRSRPQHQERTWNCCDAGLGQQVSM
jgi:hypothetical protein